MQALIDDREARRRAIRLLRFEDGLWDILLGAVFLLMSVYPVTRNLLGPKWNFLVFCLALAALVGGAAWARVALVIPRRGMATPRPSTVRSLSLVFRTTLFLTLLGIVLWTLFATSVIPSPTSGAVLEWDHTLAPGILVAFLLILVFSLIARSAGVGRIYAYGWLLGLGNLGSSALDHYAGYTFGFPLALAAGIIAAVGIVVLARFLRDYPIPRPEA